MSSDDDDVVSQREHNDDDDDNVYYRLTILTMELLKWQKNSAECDTKSSYVSKLEEFFSLNSFEFIFDSLIENDDELMLESFGGREVLREKEIECRFEWRPKMKIETNSGLSKYHIQEMD